MIKLQTQNHLFKQGNSIIRILLLLVIFTAFNCSKEVITEPEYSQDYFPLSVGNKWIFKSGEIEWSIEVMGRKLISSHNYFIVVRTYENIPDTGYYRINGLRQILVNFEGTDYLFIDFMKTPGETWDTFGTMFAKVRNLNLIVTVPAGTFNDVTEIYFDNYELSDLYEHNYYAPGIGLIRSVGFRRVSELISAFVNGVNIPR